MVQDNCTTFYVDGETRAISTPADAGVLIVAGDRNMRPLRLAVPAAYHGTDMAELSWKVLWSNGIDTGADLIGRGEGDGTYVRFEWTPCAAACAEPGILQFSLCGEELGEDGSEVLREWHTVPASTEVAETLEHADVIDDETARDWLFKVSEAIGRCDEAVGMIDAKLEEACAAAEEEIAAAEEERAIAELGRAEAEAQRAAQFADMEQRSRGWLRYICQPGEFDPDTRQPIISEPHAGTMYFVPSAIPTEQSMYQEWIWVSGDERWESFGEVELSITPASPDQLAAVLDGTDGGEGGGEVVNLTGWRSVVPRLKAMFAGIVHKHSGADLTDGTVTAAKLASAAVTQAKIADGSVSLAKCDSSLRDSVSRAGTSSSTIQWARFGKIVVIAGRCVATNESNVTVLTLPAGCRPGVHAEAPTVTGGYAGANTDGTVVVHAKPGNNFFTLCFPTA